MPPRQNGCPQKEGKPMPKKIAPLSDIQIRTAKPREKDYKVDLIEHQLAHAVRDANSRAYNRTSHLPERRKMMQLWADYLEGLKKGAKVIPLVKAAQ